MVISLHNALQFLRKGSPISSAVRSGGLLPKTGAPHVLSFPASVHSEQAIFRTALTQHCTEPGSFNEASRAEYLTGAPGRRNAACKNEWVHLHVPVLKRSLPPGGGTLAALEADRARTGLNSHSKQTRGIAPTHL